MNSIAVRMAFYVLSSLITSIVPLMAGWGVTYVDGTLTIEVQTLIAAVASGGLLSGGVLAKWGKK